MNNTALFDYYYSRRPAISRAAAHDPGGMANWESLRSFRESCRAQRAMRALMAGSHSMAALPADRQDFRPRAS